MLQSPGIKAAPGLNSGRVMKSFTVTALLAMATSAFGRTISAAPAAPAKVRRRHLPWITLGKWLAFYSGSALKLELPMVSLIGKELAVRLTP